MIERVRRLQWGRTTSASLPAAGSKRGRTGAASLPVVGSERGQTTAEYALVILGAAAVALLVLAWATDTGMVSTLLNKVIRSVADQVT